MPRILACWGLLWPAMLLIVSGCQAPGRQTPPSPRPFAGLGLLETPSNSRDWSPDLAVLPYAEADGDEIVLRNVRRCTYASDEDYVVAHYDKRFKLGDVQSVDFVMVPFRETPSLAHTMLSFGLANGDFFAVSVEARLEKGERYHPVMGALRQYELMYVIADERDVILRRTLHRGVDVYVYPTVATPEQAQALLVDVLRRTNSLARQPEFYDTFSNNCTSNLVQHLNRLSPDSVPYDMRVLLPGYSDVVAYERGLLRSYVSFAETRRRARVTEVANRFANAPDFSSSIRR